MNIRTFALVAACSGASAFIGTIAGTRYVMGHQPAAPATVVSDKTPGEQYRALSVADMFADVAVTQTNVGHVSARWNIPNAVPPEQNKPSKLTAPKQLSEVEIQQRVVAEINRLGSEGWKLCEMNEQAWPAAIPRDGVIYFRKSR